MLSFEEHAIALRKLLNEFCENVYPLVATEGTKYPFIIYQRSNGYDTGTKDGNLTYINYEVRIVTSTYADGLLLADKLRYAIRHNEPKGTLTGSSEDYTEDGYIQTLYFMFVD